MEVHNHSHASHAKGLKGWLLEFFMLFVAVTCGVFAENQREHFVERERAHEFAQSLYDDVKEDTAALQAVIQFSLQKEMACDTVMTLFAEPRNRWNDTLIYRQVSFLTRLLPFEPMEGTYEQIRASGSLRYFRPHMVKLMNSYDVQAKKVLMREQLHQEYTTMQFLPFVMKHFDMQTLDDIRQGSAMTHQVYFMNLENDHLREASNQVAAIKMLRSRTVLEYQKSFQMALGLLAELKKEFKLVDKEEE